MPLRRTLACTALALSTALAAHTQMAGSQMAGMSMPATPTGPVTPASSYDASVSALEKLWTGAANAMPADKYSFAPSAALFVPGLAVKFDGVRTWAQLCTHTIQANYRYFGLVGGIKPDADMAAIGKLTTKADILKAFADTFAFAHKAVANVTAANAFESVGAPRMPPSTTRASVFAGAIAHAEDEYGQAVEYLRMNAIIPPASAPREP